MKDIKLELRSTLKTDVTDEDGQFSFEDVSCGKHSLTAPENEKIMGYTEFVLNEGVTVDFHLEDNGVYTVTADQNEIGIDLILHVTDHGNMCIENVETVKGNALMTIVTQYFWLWCAAFIVIAVGVGGLILHFQKKK